MKFYNSGDRNQEEKLSEVRKEINPQRNHEQISQENRSRTMPCSTCTNKGSHGEWNGENK